MSEGTGMTLAIRSGIALLTVAASVGWFSDAAAQDDAFNAKVQEAMNHYRAKQYSQAIEKFEAAYAIREQPELIYNIARAYEKSLKRDDAIRTYERFLALPGTTADLRAKALQALNALRREQRLEEQSKNPPAGPSGTGMTAGPTGGGVIAQPPPPKDRTLEWSLIGGGAAVTAVGAVFGVLALSGQSELDDLKADRAPLTQQNDKVDEVNRNALIADIGIGVGLVAAGTGLVLMLVDGGNDQVAIAPAIGSDSAGFAMSGRF